MTDNGTAGGLKERTRLQRRHAGHEDSDYDGGHRVPFIIRWPKRKYRSREIGRASQAHIDILPTFIELCGLHAPDIEFDGSDISDLLYTDGEEWPDRALVVESQRVVDPINGARTAITDPSAPGQRQGTL